MSLADAFWLAKSCWKGSRKCEPRDKVVVDGEEVKYFLWGSQIATWNKTCKTLRVDDCGWKTPLTFKRLNVILSKFWLSIHSVRGANYLVNAPFGKEYFWEGQHLICLETFEVQPGVLRKTNPKGSLSLRRYYALASEIVGKRGLLTTKTLTDEVVCLIPKRYGRERFCLSLFGLYVNGDSFRGFVGEVACSKVYSAFVKNTAESLADHLAQKGEELCGREILSALQEFRVESIYLPVEVLRQLAFLKLVEA
ncbi:MAG: hypothetical protein FWF66_03875 [Candidatus Bathyarchaeota archaeon]|nr:hypothetical protein [Candidatus Termiticorpusculum sp.]